MIESNGRSLMRPADSEDKRDAALREKGRDKGGVLCCSRPSRDQLGSPEGVLWSTVELVFAPNVQI